MPITIYRANHDEVLGKNFRELYSEHDIFAWEWGEKLSANRAESLLQNLSSGKIGIAELMTYPEIYMSQLPQTSEIYQLIYNSQKRIILEKSPFMTQDVLNILYDFSCAFQNLFDKQKYIAKMKTVLQADANQERERDENFADLLKKLYSAHQESRILVLIGMAHILHEVLNRKSLEHQVILHNPNYVDSVRDEIGKKYMRREAVEDIDILKVMPENYITQYFIENGLKETESCIKARIIIDKLSKEDLEKVFEITSRHEDNLRPYAIVKLLKSCGHTID